MVECLPKCRNECYKISHLKVDGEDIKAIGYSGKEIGIVLNFLLSAVIEEHIPNEHNVLMEYLQNLS